MKRKLSDRDLLTELEPAAEENLNRHLAMAVEWHPHDYVPWDQGRNFAAMGGADWDPEQSQLSEVAKAAIITRLRSTSPWTARGARGSGAGRPRKRGTAS
jgi:acyl-[acyl-carrier-protein] desaturase